MRRRFGLIALLLGVALVATACPAEEKKVTAGPLGSVTIGADEPIKIAALQTQSGDRAALGIDEVRGIEIAVADRNGKLLDHDIQLLVEDEQCSSAGGQAAIQKVLADEQVVGIVGTTCSGAGVPASEAMSKAGLVMISGSTTTPFLTSIGGKEGTDHHDGFFRTSHNDEIQGATAANFAFKELGVKKAATIHDGDPYTSGLAGVFNDIFKKLGGEIVVATSVRPKDPNVGPVLTEIAAAKAELIFFPIFQPEGDFIVKTAKTIKGLETTALMGADGLLGAPFLVFPETADTAAGPKGRERGMYFSGPATPKGSAYEKLVADYEKKYGEKPIFPFHGHAYDAFNILAGAIEEVAVEQDDGSLVIDRQKLRDAVADTKDFEGVTGTLTCDEFGDCADAKINVVQRTKTVADLSAVNKNILFTFEPEL